MKLISGILLFINFLVILNAVASNISLEGRKRPETREMYSDISVEVREGLEGREMYSIISLEAREMYCPAADDIVPCKCVKNPDSSHLYDIVCEKIFDVEVLRRVFRILNAFRFEQVIIGSSALQYLPHEMFENTDVYELLLVKVSLGRLFDSPPEALNLLKALRIRNCRISMAMDWSLLEPLTDIRTLEIDHSTLRPFSSDFNKYVSKKLKWFIFKGTKIRKIKSGVLTEYEYLDLIYFCGCALTEIKRDVLPRPFNGRYLHLDGNKIDTIPEDLFTNMPNLVVLSMKDNLISVLPESAFGGRVGQFMLLILSGNPLECDCQILWLIEKKPYFLEGTCASPYKFRGMQLRHLQPSDFHC